MRSPGPRLSLLLDDGGCNSGIVIRVAVVDVGRPVDGALGLRRVGLEGKGRRALAYIVEDVQALVVHLLTGLFAHHGGDGLPEHLCHCSRPRA